MTSVSCKWGTPSPRMRHGAGHRAIPPGPFPLPAAPSPMTRPMGMGPTGYHCAPGPAVSSITWAAELAGVFSSARSLEVPPMARKAMRV